MRKKIVVIAGTECFNFDKSLTHLQRIDQQKKWNNAYMEQDEMK